MTSGSEQTERWILEQALRLQKELDRLDKRQRVAEEKLAARYDGLRFAAIQTYPDQVIALVEQAKERGYGDA